VPRIYLYFPFTNWEEDSVLKNDVKGFKKVGLEFELAERSTEKCLAPVNDDDLLIISGHGGVGSANISMVGATGRVRLPASSLADLLATDGLPKTHQSILLITCYGGGMSSITSAEGNADLSGSEQSSVPSKAASTRVAAKNLELISNKAGECLASILAKGLGMKGYYSILVGGWPGAFATASSATSGTASVFKAGPDKTPVLAQLDHIQWYDARGNLQ